MGAVFPILDHGDGVGLTQIQTGIIEIADLRRDHESRGSGRICAVVSNPRKPYGDGGYLKLCLKANLESDISLRVVIVVDANLIQDVWVEGKPVWTVCRLQQRIHVHNDGDFGARSVGRLVGAIAHKSVHISNVCFVIQGGDGRLTVTGSESAGPRDHSSTHHEYKGISKPLHRLSP